VVLIALFELNTPEFTMLLGALPKTFQDGTTKLLHNHLRNASSGISMVMLLSTTWCGGNTLLFTVWSAGGAVGCVSQSGSRK